LKNGFILLYSAVVKRIKDVLREKKLLNGVRRVIIGYSGGPDSMLLAEVLCDFKDIEVILAYFNHNLREDSKDEENFVKREAKKRRLKLRVDGANVRDYCNRFSFSIEEGARNLRLAYLRKVKEEENADLIVLGHNLDDKIENFFIRLLRGSGFGLSRMTYQDGDILRPLLDFRKNEIIDYLKENRIDFYIDPSNKSEDYLRNKIRINLVPLLEEIQEGSIGNIGRSIDNLRDVEKALEKQIDGIKITRHLHYAEIDIDDFVPLPSACKFLIISKMLSFFDSNLELKRAHLEKFPTRGVVELKSSKIEILPSRVIVMKNIDEKGKEVPLSGKISYGCYNIETEVVSPPVKLVVNGCEFFDLDSLKLPLKIRKRRVGDRIVVFGDQNSRKLKDLFIDSKIPRVLRDFHPIISDKKGIILIPGIRRSNRAPVIEKTKRILKIRYKEVTNGRRKR
jgi:tRNA(Ile)-lysidine synthase